MGFAADLATRGRKRCKVVLATGILQIQHDFSLRLRLDSYGPFGSCLESLVFFHQPADGRWIHILRFNSDCNEAVVIWQAK